MDAPLRRSTRLSQFPCAFVPPDMLPRLLDRSTAFDTLHQLVGIWNARNCTQVKVQKTMRSKNHTTRSAFSSHVTVGVPVQGGCRYELLRGIAQRNQKADAEADAVANLVRLLLSHPSVKNSARQHVEERYRKQPLRVLAASSPMSVTDKAGEGKPVDGEEEEEEDTSSTGSSDSETADTSENDQSPHPVYADDHLPKEMDMYRLTARNANLQLQLEDLRRQNAETNRQLMMARSVIVKLLKERAVVRHTLDSFAHTSDVSSPQNNNTTALSVDPKGLSFGTGCMPFFPVLGSPLSSTANPIDFAYKSDSTE